VLATSASGRSRRVGMVEIVRWRVIMVVDEVFDDERCDSYRRAVVLEAETIYVGNGSDNKGTGVVPRVI
jgi:hypothetical protein